MPHPLPPADNVAPKVTVQFFVPDPPYDIDQDHARSRELGRPVFRDVEYVKIIIPGDDLNKPIQRAHDKVLRNPHGGEMLSYAQCFHEEYAMFKAGREDQVVGTPLSELTSLTAAKRHELKRIGILTVEQLAGLDATQLRKIGMDGNELKALARAYMDRAKDAAVDARFAAENAALRNQMEALQAQIDAMAAKPAPAAANDATEKAEPGIFDDFDDGALKTFIKDRTGEAPRGRVSRETLIETAMGIYQREMTEAA